MGMNAAALVGDSPTATDALSSLGGDLTLSISFAIANELLAAARDADLGEAELIGIVLSTSIVLSALPNALWLARTELMAAYASLRPAGPSGPAGGASGKVSARRPQIAPNSANLHEASGLLAFFALFVRVAQRISMSICVQLIAANVRVQQPLRAVRVVTLLGVAVFFVFLESTATLGRVQRR